MQASFAQSDLAEVETEVTTVVDAGARVHILHGGAADAASVMRFAAHLQTVWRGGTLWIDTPARMAEAGAALPRLAAQPVLAVASAAIVSAAPDAYDQLCRTHSVTTLLHMPLDAVTGKRYSSRADFMVMVLPSCRLAPASVLEGALRVYRSPAAPGVVALQLAHMPHGCALAWRVGKSAATTLVTFPLPATQTSVQNAVDGAFWWAAAAAAAALARQVPLVPFRVHFASLSLIHI